MSCNEWTQYREECQNKPFQPIKEPVYNYDRMKALEDNSPYEFDTITKTKVLASEVKDKAVETAKSIDNTIQNIGSGITFTAKVLKYAPIVILGAFVWKITR